MAQIGKDEIVRLFGPVADHTSVEIIELGANMEELELASLRLADEDDVLGELREPITGNAGRVYDIIIRDPLYADEDEPDRGRKD